MILDPSAYSSAPVYDLLTAAGRGLIGLDHRWVHAIVDRGEAALPDLLRFAEEDHNEDPVFLEEDLIAMFRYLNTPEAIPFFLQCVRVEPSEIPDELVEALHQFGPQVVEPLLALYEELGEEEGGEVAFLLASLGVRDPRILQILIDRLEYDLADAALSLGLYGDPAGKLPLEANLDSLDPDDPETADLRHDLSDAIEQLNQPPQENIVEPFDLWALYPEHAEPQFDLLSIADRLQIMDGPNADYRREVAGSFFNTDLPPEVRDRLFQAAKEDPDPRVRARCWETVGTSAEDKEVRLALLARLENPEVDPVERAGVIVGLSSESHEPVVYAAIMALYHDPAYRAKALEAMWRSLDKRFGEFFPPLLGDADLEIRRNAVWGVGYLGMGGESGRLADLFKDEELRADALFAYALAVPTDISRGRIRGVLRKIDKRADGLTPSETNLVMLALDERLALHGLEPVFANEAAPEEEEEE